MRIAHIIAGVPIESGGPTQVLREMSARLAARGHVVTVITTDSGGADRRVVDAGFAPGVAVELWPAQLRRSPHPSIGHLVAMTRARFDVAHVHGLFALPVSLAMGVLRARGLPYVLRPCGMLDAYSLAQRPGLKRAWLAAGERANIVGAAAIQASTEHEADAVRALVPTAKVVVLPQGVEPPPAAAQRPHARPYLLFLSRVAKKKGLDLLVQAVAALPHDLDLVIVGPDEQGHGAEIAALVATLGLSSRVVFAGAARGVGKSDWFAHAEAFVLPSADENFGVVVIEAAHLGAPIVVSDQVGLAPAVVAHDAGVVCTRDVPALVAAITSVLADRERYRRGTAALAAAFGWDRLVRQLEALYVDVVRRVP